MSNQGSTTANSFREYAAAEERLLDILSPLCSPDAGHADTASNAERITTPANTLGHQVMDPSRDNMLAYITEDSEIHSLLSNSQGSEFKGFDDQFQHFHDASNISELMEQPRVFGIFRHSENVEIISNDNCLNCPTTQKAVFSRPIANTNEAMLESGKSCDYMLTNGTDSNSVHDVHTDQKMEHAFLCEVQPGPEDEQQLGNGVYIIEFPTEDDAEASENQHVYLSDAALVEQQEQQEQLRFDTVEEEAHNISDSYLDERPDICEVYDHELEEHDDEEQQESNLQLHLQNSMDLEQRQSDALPVDNPEQIIPTAVVYVARSSTTKFPVSSTSRPNASDYDDYENELVTHDEQPRRAQRKYMKNTLSAEALDHRLANICRAHPQMSLSEKFTNWNCSANCDPVEDVENFDAIFQQHEAKPTQQPKFDEFCDKLQKMPTIIQSSKQHSFDGAPSTMGAQDTAYSSDDVATLVRPTYRRLLQVVPAVQVIPAVQVVPIEKPELIVLDDDDDDDCYEVELNPSQSTLVNQDEPDVKTMHTQTQSLGLQKSKETSTTDLVTLTPPPVLLKCENVVPKQEQVILPQQRIAGVSKDECKQYLTETSQDDQMEPIRQSLRLNSMEFHTDAQLYEQHEFCNYLGLTELATANAVANAMRELANSTVARRSLRVRTQQQLDRMRSDVRGKRKERQQQIKPHEEQQPPHEGEENVNQQFDTSSNSSHNASTTKKNMAMIASETVITTAMTTTNTIATVPENNDTFMYPMPSALNPDSKGYDFYYGSQHGQGHASNFVTAKEYHRLSLEAAFAKVYAAAPPAQNDLHVRIQDRLKHARETKPSIYIVKTLNNSAPAGTSATSTISPTHNDLPERSKSTKSPQPADVGKKSRKSPKKAAQKMIKRRRTTAGALNSPKSHERDLVTRSTTHMNSKLLRNRKINLLKSYVLSDVTAQGRGKNRLSGGSTMTCKRLCISKTSKKGAKKAEVPYTPVHPYQQYSLEQQQNIALHQQQQQSSSKTKTTRSPVNPEQTEPKSSVKRKRLRTKSMPMDFNKEHGQQHQQHQQHQQKQKLQQQQQPSVVGDADHSSNATLINSITQFPTNNPLMETDGFIRQHGVVSPPLFTSAMHQYVNAVCKPNMRNLGGQHLKQHEQLLYQQSQQVEDFFDLSGSFAPLAKPALNYPSLSPPPSQRTPHFSRRARQISESPVKSPEFNLSDFQMTPPGGLLSLTKGSTTLRNPLAGKNGKVLYIFYELDQLIVVQEKLVSFWKYSKVFNVLHYVKSDANQATATAPPHHPSTNASQKSGRNSTESNINNVKEQRWVHLGGSRRITSDIEISAPYGNRLCAHNSTPVYIEMRSHPLDHHRRDSTLLSLYVNVYYYCEEELRPKMHSVHLDAVNCESEQVIYTSIADSRYFVMAWQQDVVVAKQRAGICKYSLTPTLDTLASIREFKQLRHELKHIECLTEDRLIGYGQTRITIWDHRSGDTLMNYDLGFTLGHSLGVMHFSSFDIDQSSILVLYQHVREAQNWPELRIIACELSHATPSHRLLHTHRLPSPQFDCNLTAINTGDHLILKSQTGDEIWISTSDPRELTYLAPQGNKRFYSRQKSQVIVMTPDKLNVDSISNHVLKLATQHQHMTILAAEAVAATTGQHLSI